MTAAEPFGQARRAIRSTERWRRRRRSDAAEDHPRRCCASAAVSPSAAMWPRKRASTGRSGVGTMPRLRRRGTRRAPSGRSRDRQRSAVGPEARAPAARRSSSARAEERAMAAARDRGCSRARARADDPSSRSRRSASGLPRRACGHPGAPSARSSAAGCRRAVRVGELLADVGLARDRARRGAGGLVGALRRVAHRHFVAEHGRPSSAGGYGGGAARIHAARSCATAAPPSSGGAVTWPWPSNVMPIGAAGVA